MATLPAQAVEQWSDPRWRLNNLYWITDKTGERVRFEMNWAQEQLYNELHFANLILKARQLGFTTLIQLIMLDACMFTSDIRAGVIAHNREDAEAFFQDKVRFPYENLPDQIKAVNPASQDAARVLKFHNNSMLRVGTSLRSGTFQFLHISEYGKICAKFPDKAKEIKTGALNTVQAGQMIFVESTAEGNEGDFHEKCEQAQTAQRRGSALTSLDFKFHFFPWWREAAYELDAEGVEIPAESARYFDELEAKYGISLTPRKQAWYVKKSIQQGASDMKREFPSTPREAFEASVEGAYYGEAIAKLEQQKRITQVAYDEALRVETWWDLGIGDSMAIWFVQRAGPNLHAIDYYANSGEGLKHYADMLDDKRREHGYLYGDMLWPHDGNFRVLDENARRRSKIMEGLGYAPVIVKRSMDVGADIDKVRTVIPRFYFDAEKCADGLKCLKNYRKEWDEERGCWKPRALHNWASHGADALRTGALYEPITATNAPLVIPTNHVSNHVV